MSTALKRLCIRETKSRGMVNCSIDGKSFPPRTSTFFIRAIHTSAKKSLNVIIALFLKKSIALKENTARKISLR
jgi:hypothetical protein